MKINPVVRWLAVTTLLFLGSGALFGQTKQIRLRNQTITTDPAASAPPTAQAKVEIAKSGLLLVQFNSATQPEWPEALRAAGVELLSYVPDDAFVARATQARLDDVRRLPFVRWVGDYRPDHKVWAGLGDGRARTINGAMAVSVLTTSDTRPAESATLSRNFQQVEQRSTSRFGTVLRGRVSADGLKQLAASPHVLWIERAPQMRLYDEVSTKIVAGQGNGGHLATVHELGFTGAGVTVSVADTGLDTGNRDAMHPDIAGRVLALLYYGPLSDAADEHGHGTHCAGIVAGDGAFGETDEFNYLYGLGVAPGASLVGQRIFDGEGNFTYPDVSYEPLTRDAVQAGANIGSNSWGDDTQGRYDISAMQFDALVRDADAITPDDQPYVLEFSAGNAGPGAQTVGSPAVGKNVIATGASQSDRADFFLYADGPETMADFSSRGPCEDGRIKPDVVCPGTWIASLRSVFANDDNSWAPISEHYLYEGGTSQAGPHAAGAAAVFMQYYRSTHTNQTPSPALVKAALINSAWDMDDEVETGPVPNGDEGWGRVDLEELIANDRVHEFVDQSVLLRTGQQFEHHTVVSSSEAPLRITLAYTDVPASPAVIPSLVNDLDLEVVGPDGRVYHGNQFLDGESVPDVAVADAINNVEAVHILEPLPGEYVIRVKARNVPADARIDTSAKDQDFALVISGTIPPAGQGILLFDRPAYTAPSRINLKLIDADLAAQASVTVPLKSTLQSAGFDVVLKPTGSSGTFTGSVATALGPVAADGKLHIAHGNVITAEYFDASAGVTRVATAAGDLLPPVITAVGTANEFGETVATWLTDEPANSVVRYATNTPLTLVASNGFFVTDHGVPLTNVVAGRSYKFLVVSTDAAGNTATNSNNGAFYSFTAAAAATVLLVNDFPVAAEDPPLPLSEYTNAIAGAGVSFDVWNVVRGSQRVYPTLNNLKPYRVVMWRINDSINLQSRPTIPSAQQLAIQQYLDGGGSFFMASMEILSLLGAVPFRTNVLHVAEFLPNTSGGFEPCPECDEDHGVPSVDGVASDPVSAGISLNLDYSQFPYIDLVIIVIGPDVSDIFKPTTNAAPILIEPSSLRAAGTKYPRTGADSTGRVVFLSFPLEAIPEAGPPPNNRSAFLRNVLQFLAPGSGQFATVALDRESYTAPDTVTVEVTDPGLAGVTNGTIRFRSDTDVTGVAVTLRPTPQEALQRGTVLLVGANEAPGPGRLRVKQGDVLKAEYFDASTLSTVSAQADIDTVVPTLSNVAIEPDYESATISWDTSEFTDALVQFGESTFLSHTAYDPEFDTGHEVVLPGLQPDRLYYFKIVSRDAAGNVVEDDNHGQLYTFRTKRPLLPPFIDHFDSGNSLWTVFSGEDSYSQWQLGVPSNGFETAAHSPPNAWGSNLEGGSLDLADTFLISPAIQLTGGNVATLRFWHSYDFLERNPFDLLEGGELLLVTNGAAAAITLGVFDDYQSWDLEEIDLTPYLNHTIYLVWHYQLLSFEAEPRPGWLVDDVEVTVEDIPPGTIRVTNNVFQSQFTLTGPMNRSGLGTSLVVTGAPPGEYVLTWGAVPFFLTPSAETATLISGKTLVFTGNYTFTDANQNGIPDPFEQQYFGSVAANHPGSQDTDGDGASDLGEFWAGTIPTNSASVLHVKITEVQTNGAVRFEWNAGVGRGYRLWGSPDFEAWQPLTEWQRVTGGLTSLTVPPATLSNRRFFRLEVRP